MIKHMHQSRLCMMKCQIYIYMLMGYISLHKVYIPLEYYISRHDIFNVGSMRKFAAISVAVWRVKHDGKV